MIVKCRLKDLMRGKGVDQKTVAADTGISPTTISKWARNNFSQIDTEIATKLMGYFGLTTLDDLFEVVLEPGIDVG